MLFAGPPGAGKTTHIEAFSRASSPSVQVIAVGPVEDGRDCPVRKGPSRVLMVGAPAPGETSPEIIEVMVYPSREQRRAVSKTVKGFSR